MGDTLPPVDGWLLLDKPEGLSSNHALQRVKRLLGIQRAGHAGTLDPEASGLLLIALGEARKFLQLLEHSRKTYRFELHWGTATDTEDSAGKIIAESPVRPTAEAIQAALPGFHGEYLQTPSAFSALKQDGVRAYTLARQGKAVSLPPRRVTVHALTLPEHDPDHGVSTLEVCFGKGGYVRALGRDLAKALGTVGHCQHIRRTKIGPLTVANAFSLATLQTRADNDREMAGIVLPLGSVLDGIPALDVTAESMRRLIQGQRRRMDQLVVPQENQTATLLHTGAVLFRHQGQIFGFGQVDGDLVRPKRITAQPRNPRPIPGETP